MLLLDKPYIIFNPSEAPIKVSLDEILSTVTPRILSTIAHNHDKEIIKAATPSSTSMIAVANLKTPKKAWLAARRSL